MIQFKATVRRPGASAPAVLDADGDGRITLAEIARFPRLVDGPVSEAARALRRLVGRS